MKMRRFLVSAAFFLLSVAILLTVVDICCFNRGFYRREYERDLTYEKIGMSEEDLMAATDTLLGYLKDDRDDIVIRCTVNGADRAVFNERETAHMVDVKDLYQNALLCRNIFFAVSLAILALAWYRDKKEFPRLVRSGFRSGLMFMMIFVFFIGIWVVTDFDAFWTNIHHVFFRNDLWLLDPATSIMINMFPSIFFDDLVVRILTFFIAAVALLAGIIYLPKRRSA